MNAFDILALRQKFAAAALAAPAGEPEWLAEAERLIDAHDEAWHDSDSDRLLRTHAALLAHLRTRPSVEQP